MAYNLIVAAKATRKNKMTILEICNKLRAAGHDSHARALHQLSREAKRRNLGRNDAKGSQSKLRDCAEAAKVKLGI